MKTKEYEYKNLPIPGGGYVTGFLFSQVEKDVMYIRTDIGGTYKYDYSSGRFISLIDHVGMTDLSETFPISLATNAKKGSLYIACGVGHERNGELCISKDYGKTFEVKNLPVMAHGNWNGRGTSERLQIAEDGRIYFASPRNGLWISDDDGDTWKELEVFGEKHFTFVFLRPKTDTVIVATAGVTTKRSDELRGHSLYISYDRGEHFEPMNEPFVEKMEHSKMTGFVGHRYTYDGKNLYITINHTGERVYIVEPGYSCDAGHVVGGMILKYSFDDMGRVSDWENIAPEKNYLELDYGYGGISYSKTVPGLMVVSTITRLFGDRVYRSFDYGKTWENVLEGLNVGKIVFNAPYMKPEYNGNGSLIHWLTDIQINPYNGNEVWFNTGTGVFRCQNFTAPLPVFEDHCDGIEETVHLNVYAPLEGDVQLIDILGDLGGFAFREVDKPCENSFADSEGNRYITCINADYADSFPECAVITPRGNWTGKTKGGLIITRDGFKSFERIRLPYGMSKELDDHFSAIERPNVNAGWVAMSSDTMNIVWSVADGIRLPKDLVICSADQGKTWKKVLIKNCNDEFFKVFSDRVNPKLFYGFTEKGNFYVSTDGGQEFDKVDAEMAIDGVDFGLIDCANKTELRVESGKEGVMYIACNKKGLVKLCYDINSNTAKTERLTKEGDIVYKMGLGIISPGADYKNSKKAIYFNGIIDGKYGFYRTLDECLNFELLNNSNQQYGEINSIDGDKRIFGRFYLATGSRGVLYGQPV